MVERKKRTDLVPFYRPQCLSEARHTRELREV